MSKLNSNAIFELIHSLGKNEKRGFKQFAKSHVIGEKNNYLKLYDLIDRQKKFDEQKLADQLQISIKNLRDRKSYLYNMILRSLHRFHSNLNANTNTYNSLLSIEILNSKGLHDHTFPIIEKEKVSAKNQENFPMHHVFLDSWLRAQSYFQYDKITLDEIVNYKRECAMLIRLHAEFLTYTGDLVHSTKLLRGLGYSTTGGSKGQMKMLQSLMPKVQENSILSEKSKVSYHHMLGNYYLFRGNFTKRLFHREALLAVLLNHPDMFKRQYVLASILNLLDSCIISKEYDKYRKYRIVFNELIGKYNVVENRFKGSAQIIHLQYLISHKEFNRAYLEFQDFMKKNEVPNNKLQAINFYHHASILCFYLAKIKESLRYTNSSMNILSRELLTQDFANFTAVFNLIVHFELNNFDLIEYQVKSVYRQLKSDPHPHEFEHEIAYAIRQMANAPFDKLSLLEAFSDLRNRLSILKRTHSYREELYFDNFNILAWLDSKIKNEPLEKILRSWS